jgi:hypothetical protein
MKILHVLICVTLVSYANCLTETFMEAIKSITRTKRDADGQCSISCLTTIASTIQESSAIQDYLPVQKKNPLTVCRFYEPGQVKEMCSVKSQGRKCLGTCSNDATKDLANKMLDAFFICNDQFKDFPNLYPCIEKNCADVDKACAEACHSSRGMADKLSEFSAGQSTKPEIDLETTKTIIGDTCKYLSCYDRCAHPKFAEKCGNATADLEIGVTSQTIKATTDVLSAVGASSIIPVACENLAALTPSENVTESVFF